MGLLLGTLCDNPSTLNLWVLEAVMALLAPVLALGLVHAGLPAWLRAVAPWTPTVAMARLVGLATAGAVPAADVAHNVLILATEALALYALVAWRVRQMDR